jgi:hypothetical protein
MSGGLLDIIVVGITIGTLIVMGFFCTLPFKMSENICFALGGVFMVIFALLEQLVNSIYESGEHVYKSLPSTSRINMPSTVDIVNKLFYGNRMKGGSKRNKRNSRRKRNTRRKRNSRRKFNK